MNQVSENDLNFMNDRIEVKHLVHQGQIDQAIVKLNEIDEQILVQNQELKYNILLQKLIEFIKENKIQDAISYAQQDLVPLIEQNPSFIESLEQVMSLLAFQKIEACPQADLIKNSQRIKISSEINQEILKFKSQETGSQLTSLIKLLLWKQKKLSELVEFPQIIQIQTAEFNEKLQNNN